jgi:hypothetical protein
MISTSARLATVLKQVQECIDKYNQQPHKDYAFEFKRFQIILESMLEKYNDEAAQHLLDEILPNLTREANLLD